MIEMVESRRKETEKSENPSKLEKLFKSGRPHEWDKELKERTFEELVVELIETAFESIRLVFIYMISTRAMSLDQKSRGC